MKCEFKKLIEKTKKNSPHHHSNFKTDTLYNLSHSLGPENINIYIYIQIHILSLTLQLFIVTNGQNLKKIQIKRILAISSKAMTTMTEYLVRE